METFISTLSFTEQGAKGIQKTCARAEAFRAAAVKSGIKVRDIYWTLGATDGLVIFDAPDEETATALILKLAADGNVRTQTARAYNTEEMSGIVGEA
jgi:uncharacterized protein with GYD domain